MKSCSRCKQIKPDASFRKRKQRDVLDSHCYQCRNEVRQLNRQRYPEQKRLDLLERRIDGDPMAHAYIIATHVSKYVGNAIERWERRRQSEAHPHLTAIKQLADDLATQVLEPALDRPAIRCEWCGEEFEPYRYDQRFCCSTHRNSAASRKRVLSGENRERMRRRTQAMPSDASG